MVREAKSSPLNIKQSLPVSQINLWGDQRDTTCQVPNYPGSARQKSRLPIWPCSIIPYTSRVYNPITLSSHPPGLRLWVPSQRGTNNATNLSPTVFPGRN